MQRPRILFVDDDDLFLRAVARALRRYESRWDTTFVVGGARGVSLIETSEPFDVIVTDLEMPGANGLAVLHAAERRSPTACRILWTGAQVDPSTVNAHAVFSKLDGVSLLCEVIGLVASGPPAASPAHEFRAAIAELRATPSLADD